MKFYYNKYNSVEDSVSYSNHVPPGADGAAQDWPIYHFYRYAVPGYSFDTTDGFLPAGTPTYEVDFVPGHSYWMINGTHDAVYRFSVNSVGSTTFNATVGVGYCTRNVTYVKGTLVTPNVIADNGTYPDNGRHTDGYWYVKSNLVSSMLFSNF